LERLHTEAYFLAGIAYKSKGDIITANRYFEKTFKTDLGFVPAFVTLAALKRENGMINEAISVC